jgi:hypothetical protein
MTSLQAARQLIFGVPRREFGAVYFEHWRTAMTHFASYWKWFDEEEEEPIVTCWRIRAKSRLADARRGDILWLFTSGEKCRRKLEEGELPDGGVQDSEAYLTEVFADDRILRVDDDEFPLLVEGLPQKCIGVYPPIHIDAIVRPFKHAKYKPIGSLRPGAWRLDAHLEDLLQKRLKRERPDVYREVCG